MRILIGVILTALGVVLFVCCVAVGFYRMSRWPITDLFKTSVDHKTPFLLNMLQIVLFGAAVPLMVFGVQLIVF